VKTFLQLRWFGRERMVAYSAILALASLASIYPLFLQAMGPQGSDFMAFWSAGRMAVEGHAAAAYDPAALGVVQTNAGRGEVFAFVNPPPLLLAIWPLGLMEYPYAWLTWVAVTYVLWFLATRRLYPELSWPIAAFPGVLVAAWHAQTGFLTSAIQAFAAGALRDRPFRAGLCVGALIVKPHLAVLFPVALLAGRQWRAIAGAATSSLGLLLLAWLVFGTDAMLAYPQSWAVSDYLLRTGSDTFFLRQSTIYAMVRVVLSDPAAIAAQAIASLAMAAITWRAWARTGPIEGKLALLFAATPLATPYLFNYDLPFLVIPICWLVSSLGTEDIAGWRKPALLALYVSPLVTRAMALPVGINTMPLVSLVMVVLVWRSLRDATGAESVRPAPAAGT
jgi:hypothetical protein